MRICIVTHRLSLDDGQGRVNYEIARYLAGWGHAVTLVATAVDERLAAAAGVQWRRVKVPSRLPTAALRYQAFAHGAAAALRPDRELFDIVQLNGGITFGASDVNVANFVHSGWLRSPFHPWRQSVSLNSVYQRLLTGFNARWERSAFARAEVVVAVSNLVRESLIADARVRPDRISVIPPGVDAAQFRPLLPGEPNKLRSLAGCSDGAFLLFFAGDAKSNRKNLDLVLESLAMLPPRVRLAIAGSSAGGPYPAMVGRLGLSARVCFLGHRPDVAELLRGAGAFVFPSHYDPFALVVTEAMASGVPVVTARSVGAATLVERGRAGFVLQTSNDKAGFVEAIKELISGPDAAERWALRRGRLQRRTYGKTWAAGTSPFTMPLSPPSADGAPSVAKSRHAEA